MFIETDWLDYYLAHRKAEEGIQVIEGMSVQLFAQALQDTLAD